MWVRTLEWPCGEFCAMSANMVVEFMTISKLMEAQIFVHRERLVCPFGLVTVNR